MNWEHTVYFYTVLIFWTSVELLEKKGDSKQSAY